MLGLYVRGCGFGFLLWKWMADVCGLVKVMHCRMCLVIMVLWKWTVWQW